MLPEYDAIDLLEGLFELAVDKFWAGLALLFDMTHQVGAFGATVAIFALAGVMFGAAVRYQHSLNEAIQARPEQRFSIWRAELRFTALRLVLGILTLPFRLLAAIGGALGAALKSLVSNDEPAPEAGDEPPEETPYLSASLGPSFFLASMIIALLWVLSSLLEPVLVSQLGLSEGAPAWQYLLLGQRPELVWYLPLNRFPFLGAGVTMLAWLSIWWFVARMVRLAWRADLGRNLIAARDDQGVLRPWRDWFGASKLVAVDDTYKRWARWFPLAAAPLLLWSWLLISGTPYRMPASLFAVAFIVWLGWLLNLYLEGVEHVVPEAPEPAPEPELGPAKTWRDVLTDLSERLQVPEPMTVEAPRVVQPLQAASRPPRRGLLSPLLSELQGGHGGPTEMQQTTLEQLSLASFVHTSPPGDAGHLGLGGADAEASRAQRHRNQIVLAPEGAGKTTLAILAAVNTTLMHTRSTLVVVRDAAAAAELFARFDALLTPSTLRWTVKVSLAGADFVEDVSQGTIPDVLICSLERLTLQTLDNPRSYEALLKNLGLIVIDDVESFCGPVEIHAQLALRRLLARVREELGVRELGEETAPAVLALGDDSMHKTATWARTLCGIDAVARYYGYPERGQETGMGAGQVRDASAQASAELLTDDVAGETTGADAQSLSELEEVDPGRYQVFYRLRDFARSTGERVDLTEVIMACERRGLTWHYRRCGDDTRRHGRRYLSLRQEPEHFTDDPAKAGVVFLEGTTSNVRREARRLSRAGLDYQPYRAQEADAPPIDHPVPIAMIAVCDPDEQMALTDFNATSTLADLVETLPRPVVRAPFGRIINAHLAAELSDNWLEVADVLEVFGSATARTLEQLAAERMLLTEKRVTLTRDHSDYEDLVYVRVPSRAIASPGGGASRAVLPPKVAQVELASARRVAIRDHTTLNLIDRAGAASAGHIYYPGRIIEHVSGRYVVVGQASELADWREDSAVDAGDIILEPILDDAVSSPRRRAHLSPVDGHEWAAEPVFLGAFPLAVSFGPVRCRVHHLATLRLDPASLAVRQKLIFAPGPARSPRRTELQSMAIGLFANPDLDAIDSPDCPRLRLEEARLIAATMRALLPTIYRGARQDIEVALQVEAERPTQDHILGPRDGFFLYDPHAGGNGAAAAIHRDGVDLLLRLCRIYLERVLYHDRLLARFDHWGDASATRPAARSPKLAESSRHRDRERRRRALEWLDSRLHPEGGTSARPRQARWGSGSELGEGDWFDLGRCWYSPDGTIDDLVWTKHRWLTPDEQDAAVDAGFDRVTVAHRRIYTPDAAQLAGLLAAHDSLVAGDDALGWAPQRVWALDAGASSPRGSDAALIRDEAVLAHHRLVNAVAAHNVDALGPLARLLFERSGASTAADAREQLVDYLSCFVRGLPTQPPGARLLGPLTALLTGSGDPTSQSLLLALLLKHCGVESGIFWCPSTRQARAGAALPTSRSAQTTPPEAQSPASLDAITAWSAARAHPVVWAEQAVKPAGGASALMVALSTHAAASLGDAGIQKTEPWVFLPLAPAWRAAGLGRAPGETP